MWVFYTKTIISLLESFNNSRMFNFLRKHILKCWHHFSKFVTQIWQLIWLSLGTVVRIYFVSGHVKVFHMAFKFILYKLNNVLNGVTYKFDNVITKEQKGDHKKILNLIYWVGNSIRYIELISQYCSSRALFLFDLWQRCCTSIFHVFYSK